MEVGPMGLLPVRPCHHTPRIGGSGGGLRLAHHPLDFTIPLGCAILGMLATLAEFERPLLQERIEAGISQARNKGKPFGRPKIPKNVHCQMKGLAAGGASKESIAKQFKTSRPSVIRC